MKFNHEDWQRLGRAVYTARLRAGYAETQKWAAEVGRSSRVLLGLERGEAVGNNTLDRIAAVLGAPASSPYDVLSGVATDFAWGSASGVQVEAAPTVGGGGDDPDLGTIKARKPANMTDEDFKRLLSEYQDEIEWKLNRAARDHRP